MAIEDARALVEQAGVVVVLTGAGISTDSGIPDFRGPNGIWTRDPGAERLASIDAYLADPEVRRRSWRNRLESPTWQARPNAGHRALVELERQGRLDTLATQNIDGLHQAAGNDPARVVELHGTIRQTACLRCGDRLAMSVVLDRVRQGEDDPACRAPGPGSERTCGGILKSAAISFGQSLVAADLERAELAATRCELLLCVGTSLTVHPAAGLVPAAAASGAAVVVVNAEPTPYDPLASAVVREPISEALPVLVDRH